MNLRALAFVTLTALATSLAGCAGEITPHDDADEGASADALSTVPVVTITSGGISMANGVDILRRLPGERVALRNASGHTRRLVLSDSNVIRGGADYARATKIDVPAGATVVLGTPAHPLAAGATFLGFEAPDLASGWRNDTLFTVWVGRGVARACNVTTRDFGSDSCPAWGIDADFCSCTAALPGGG